MIHMHCDMEVDLDRIADTFAKLHPRRLKLDSEALSLYDCYIYTSLFTIEMVAQFI